MQVDPHIFRAYDIRGVALTQLTVDAAEMIAFFFAEFLKEKYAESTLNIVVGRDARTHGPPLEDAVIRGLRKASCHVVSIGATPSPINYFTICDQKLDGGIHITASHNPAEDNGMKLQMRHAHAFAGEQITDLYKRIIAQTEPLPNCNEASSMKTYDAANAYETKLQSMFPAVGNDLTVVVDAGNGIAGPSACSLLRTVGCVVEELYTEPDGRFPNHPADPSQLSTLAELQENVIKTSAQCGFAFDGDGDRLGLVDETGTIRTADEILLLLARDHLSRFSGKPVVFTVSNSATLETEISQWGGVPIMCRVGHSFVEHAMQEHGALLGGEQSGHFFCAEDYEGFDDAMVAALRILQILQQSGVPLSQLCADFPKVYQSPEVRPYCPDDQKTKIIEAITKHIETQYPVVALDGARIDFGNGAWAGIRQSNTSPCLSICLEARTPEMLKEIETVVFDHIAQYPAVVFNKTS